MFKRFRTKKDLLLAVTGPYLLEIGAPDLVPVLESALADERGGFERLLRAIIRDRIEFARNHPAVIRILVQEAPFHPEILDSLSGIGSRMLTLIERFQRTGEIDPELSPATVARLIFSAILGHLLARVFVRLHEHDEPRSIDETVQVLVRGSDALLEAIRLCEESAPSERVQRYRSARLGPAAGGIVVL